MAELMDMALSLQATPCSYPSHSPLPPLPVRRDAPARTFHEECEDIVRAIHREPSPVPQNVSPRRARQAKYRAILDEVEHLNRLFETIAEERDAAAEELREKLSHAEAQLRERDDELLRLRIESLRHCDRPSDPHEAVRVAQAALQWLRFLVERGFGGEGLSGPAAAFTALLSELQRHTEASESLEASEDTAAAGRALCVRAGNEVVRVAKDAEERRVRLAALEKECAEMRWQRDTVAAENVQLLLRLKAYEDEEQQKQNKQNKQQQNQNQLGRRECSRQVEEQNVMLLAERDRQAAWIAELERQLHEAQREGESLLEKLTTQAAAVHRHERVVDMLTRGERPT